MNTDKQKIKDTLSELAEITSELKEHKENQNTFVMALLEKPEKEIEKLKNQRDRAIEIVEELLSWGHKEPCYADESKPQIRCRCSWRECDKELKQLKSEIQ